MSPTRCPSCRRALALPEALGGALLKCPACGATFPASPGGQTRRSVSPAEGSQHGPDAVTPYPPTPGEGRILPAHAEGGIGPSGPAPDPPPGRSSATGGGVGGWYWLLIVLALLFVTHFGGVCTLGTTIAGYFTSINSKL
jgi:hypothetical protein